MQQTKKSLLAIILGALLIAGLFFYFQSSEPEQNVAALKPSQLDFSQGNQIKEARTIDLPPQVSPFEVPIAKNLPEKDQKKWAVFLEALKSKNDNDPQLDAELRELSPEMHESIKAAYKLLPPEDRNGRGLAAFLIARDLKTRADAEFVKEILKESPCLSFQNCSVEAAPDPHLDGINQTSLNYPQLAALYQLEKRLEDKPEILDDPEMKSEIAEIIREGRQFPSAAVQKRAEDLEKKLRL